MKYLLMAFILVSCFGANEQQIKDAEMGAPTQQQMKKDEAKTQAPSENSEQAQNGFIEENNACICTKEYSPVCGSNGKMYPNACQAGCEGVTEFTEGPCPKKD